MLLFNNREIKGRVPFILLRERERSKVEEKINTVNKLSLETSQGLEAQRDRRVQSYFLEMKSKRQWFETRMNN